MFWVGFVDGVGFWCVSSMFWVGFVDGSGVQVCLGGGVSELVLSGG